MLERPTTIIQNKAAIKTCLICMKETLTCDAASNIKGRTGDPEPALIFNGAIASTGRSSSVEFSGLVLTFTNKKIFSSAKIRRV